MVPVFLLRANSNSERVRRDLGLGLQVVPPYGGAAAKQIIQNQFECAWCGRSVCGAACVPWLEASPASAFTLERDFRFLNQSLKRTE